MRAPFNINARPGLVQELTDPITLRDKMSRNRTDQQSAAERAVFGTVLRANPAHATANVRLTTEQREPAPIALHSPPAAGLAES